MASVPTWTVAECKALLDGTRHDEVNLVDVRQPAEFESGHLPGAVLIPLGEVSARAGELDPKLPTIVYCRSGGRSAAGTAMLMASGVSDIHNMAGGIMAWQGLVARGLPEAAFEMFAPTSGLRDTLRLVWTLEEGTRVFYESAAARIGGSAAAALDELAEAEEGHKGEVEALWRTLLGEEPQLDDVLEPSHIEGGTPLDLALQWVRDQDARSVLELALAIEATAYDRYVQLARLAPDEEHGRAFRAMAEGERAHLVLVTRLLEEHLA